MRMLLKLSLISLLGFTAESTNALTLTNRDNTERKIIIIEGDKEITEILKPGQVIETCQKSCVIKMVDGEDYQFDGTEVVSLEDGLLFLDGSIDQQKATR